MGLLDDGAWQGKLWTGEWTDGSGGTYSAVEPATGETSARSARRPRRTCTPPPLRAVEAQRAWAALPFEERAAVLRRAGDLLSRERRRDQGLAGPGVRRDPAVRRLPGAHQRRRSATRPRRCRSHPYGELLRTGAAAAVLRPPAAGRRRRRHRAVQRADHPGHPRHRPGAGAGQRGDPQARPADGDLRRRDVRPRLRGGRAARRACCRCCPAAPTSARRSWSTRPSGSSPSPAPPRPAARSARWPASTSSARTWSSAATPR